MSERIVVDPVTRIEGHAQVALEVDGAGRVESAHLQVLEFRGFEKLLERMELYKMPQVTARICGVCPPAHHLAAVTAIENGLGMTPPPAAALLRELLNCGSVIHSHALSIFVLTGPDLMLGLGAPPEQRNVFHLLAVEPELAKQVLQLRTIGQRAVEVVGGRGVHPVAAVPGGMASRPGAEAMAGIAARGRQALEIIEGLLPRVRERLAALGELREATTVPFPAAALHREGSLDFLRGTVAVRAADGSELRSFPGTDYARHLVEHVTPGSYMKAVRLRGDPEAPFFVGPLARLNVAERIGTPRAEALFAAYRAAGRPRLAMLDNIEARLIEMVHCAERMVEIAEGGLGDGPIRLPVPPAPAGRFVGLIEAPRGILIHDFTTGDDGRITAANLIVATQNNYDAIDRAIAGVARSLQPRNDEPLLMHGVEVAIRCFDPCLACATHALGRMPLEVTLTRDGVPVGRLERKVPR